MNIDPQLMAQIMGGRINPEAGGGYAQVRNFTTPDGRQFQYLANYSQGGSGDASYTDRSNTEPGMFYEDLPDNFYNTYDQSGAFSGSGKYTSSWKDMMQAIALMAGGYLGGSAFAGAGGTGAAAAGTGALEGGMSFDALMNGAMAGADGTLVGGSTLTSGGTTALGSTLGEAGALGGLSFGDIAQQAGEQALKQGSQKKDAGGLNWGSLLGAAAGALDGRDQQATSSKDPWAPAQPALRGLLSQGEALMNRPAVSDRMQSAYDRQAGLLDYAAQIAPTLMAQQQANAAGANNYTRLGGRRGLLGG